MKNSEVQIAIILLSLNKIVHNRHNRDSEENRALRRINQILMIKVDEDNTVDRITYLALFQQFSCFFFLFSLTLEVLHQGESFFEIALMT